MPNSLWSKVNHLQLGRIAEMYAQAEFISYGYEVYPSSVDDRGIDFIVRKNDAFFEIQVKAVRNYNYTFIQKSKMPNLSNERLVCYMNFIDGNLPKIYIIPASAWNNTGQVLVDRQYTDQISQPEWGIQNSKRNEHLLDEFLSEKFFIGIDNNNELSPEASSEPINNNHSADINTDTYPFIHSFPDNGEHQSAFVDDSIIREVYGSPEMIREYAESIKTNDSFVDLEKTMQLCSNCGCSLSMNAVFCPNCGNRIRAVETQEPIMRMVYASPERMGKSEMTEKEQEKTLFAKAFRRKK